MRVCVHRPGTVVEVDPADDLRSTCIDCGMPLWRIYQQGDEDRVDGWLPWRPAPVGVP